VLLIISWNIFSKFHLLDKFEIKTFINFIDEVKGGYLAENPYHNVKIIYKNLNI
jgi:hypothetical protein